MARLDDRAGVGFMKTHIMADDAGITVAILTVRELEMAAPEGRRRVIIREVRRATLCELRKSTIWPFLLRHGRVLVVLYAIIAIMVSRAIYLYSITLFIASMCVGIGLLFMAMHRRVTHTLAISDPKVLADVSLRHGICPSCGYSLGSLPKVMDAQLIICPECGSAWFVYRLCSSVEGRTRGPSDGTATPPLTML